VALGVLAFGSAVAAAGGKGQRTLRLTATENQFAFLDLGDTGTSVGDQFVFSEVLSRRGQDVGDSGATCTITELASYDTVTSNCVGTLRLRGGQITVQGLVTFQGEDDPDRFTIAITGGTGAYRGASGEMDVRSIDATRSVYKLHFDSGKRHRH
jgi:hypothetical protein